MKQRKPIIQAGSMVLAILLMVAGGIYLVNKEAGVKTMETIQKQSNANEQHEPDSAVPPTVQPVNYTISTASSMVKVMPKDELPERRNIKLSLAGNEYESFQVVVRADAKVDEAAVRIGDFVNGDHRLTDIEWYQVGYVWIDTFEGHPTPEIAETQQPGWYPDPLLPRKNVQLLENWSNPIWFTVHAPEDAAPGIYKGSVGVEINGTTNWVEVEVEVYRFSLSQKPALPTLFSLSFMHLKEVYGQVDEEMRRKWFDYVANYRISPDDLYLNPQMPEWDMAVTAHERGFYKDKVNGFTLYPVTSTWDDREASAEKLIERFEHSRPYIDQIIGTDAVNSSNGVFYGFDENEVRHFDTMKEVNAHIKKTYPNIPIATTSQYIDSYERMKELNVDILILCLFDNLYNNDFADSLRKQGKKVWAYTGMQPYNPEPNWRIENSPMEARLLLSAMALHERFDGFLYWSLNYYYKGTGAVPAPIKRNESILTNWSITTPTEEFKWLHGDGVLLYAGEDGPIGSIRMENIRDGLEDYEYYKQLEHIAGFDAAFGAADELVKSTSEFVRSPEQLYEVRQRISAMISGS